ncbi:MAG: HlyC/CorC family transporter [Nitrospirae bacterium]|nr:HlyC/CorC family transporter [Nitrospirota bacterium]
MSYDPLLILALIALLIFLNAFFSGAEIALVSCRKSRVKSLADAGDRRAKTVHRLQAEPERYFAAIQIGMTLIGTLAGAVAGESFIVGVSERLRETGVPFLVRGAEFFAYVVVVVPLALVMLIMGELVPKSLAVRFAERIALASAGPVDFLARVSAPVIRLLTIAGNFLIGLLGGKKLPETGFYTEDEIKQIIREGKEKGVFDKTEEALIHSVFRFSETQVKEIMVPRTDIAALPVEATFSDVMDLAVRDGYSRMPVYRETIDNIIGVLYVKDLLAFWDRRDEFRTEKVLRKAHFVPETKEVSVLLEEFQRQKTHMAIIIDEYVLSVGGRTYVVDGRTDIGKVNREIGVSLPEEDFETVGGLVLGLFGRLPAEGEETSVGDAKIVVAKRAGNRITKVRMMFQPLSVFVINAVYNLLKIS